MVQPHLRSVPSGQFVGSASEPPIPPSPPTPPPAATRSPQRPRASKVLPTDRMKFDAQVELLRRYARISGAAKRAVTSEEVARAQGIATNTAALNNAFFVESGWLETTGRGQHIATDALVTYNQRAQLDPANAKAATSLLAGPARQSWYWKALEPYMQGGGLPKNEALVILSSDSDAGPEYKPQLENVLQWLQFVCLVRIEGDSLLPGDGLGLASESASRAAEPVQPVVEDHPMQPTPEHSKAEATERKDVVLAFSVDFRLTASELASLSPDQIRALFEAVGAVAALTQETR